MAQKKSGTNVGTGLAVGAGVMALSAAAYLIFGPEGKKHRKDLKSWMLKMKGEVMEKMENAKELTLPVYEKILKDVETKYRAMKNVDEAALKKETAELKKNWHAMAKKAKVKKALKK